MSAAEHEGRRVELAAQAEFYRAVRVHADGSVTGVEDAPYADSLVDDDAASVAPWEPMTGYTGQYGYRGPTMHASETLGGRLADDMLATPGLYVVVESHVSEPEGCDEGHENTGCDCGLAGWAVLAIVDEVNA